MNEKTENGETCLRLKQGYTETGPQPVPHGIATGRREIWVLALQPSATRKLCSCTMYSVCQRLVSLRHVQSINKEQNNTQYSDYCQKKTFTNIFNFNSTQS